MKVKLDENNNNSDNRLKLIRDAHNAKQKVIEGQHTDRIENYLEVIYELIKKKDYATQTDISESLNVSLPRGTKMLQRLDESKYLKYEKYRGINLTEEGIEEAQNIHEKHALLSEFFKMIGVDEDVANIDAEGIEHHLHPKTLKKLREFIRNHKEEASSLESGKSPILLIQSSIFGTSQASHQTLLYNSQTASPEFQRVLEVVYLTLRTSCSASDS